MPSRNELNLRARVMGLDPATIANDSKLEQKVLYLEKNATTFTGTAGTGVLTSNNTQQSDGDTVTIGTTVYTGKTALVAATPNQYLIVTDADTSLGNLVKAINGTGTAGTDYTAGTPVNPLVTAGAVAAHATTVTVRDKAVTNADIATTETAATLSWGAGTIASGVAGVVAVAGATTKDTLAGVAGDRSNNT